MADLRYLLDTNMCIYIRKKKPERVLERFHKVDSGEVAISVITYGELLYGANKSGQSARSLATVQEFASHRASVAFARKCSRGVRIHPRGTRRPRPDGRTQ